MKVLHFKIEKTPIKDASGKRKFKRVLRFLFVDKRELFALKFSFEEFNLVFFKADQTRLACFEPTEAARYILYSMVIESAFLKGNFVCLERFHGCFLHSDSGVREKPQNVHLKLIFCDVLS